MFKKNISILIILFISNIIFSTEINKKTLENYVIFSDDFVKYISELNTINNTIILSFPSQTQNSQSSTKNTPPTNIQLIIKGPFENSASSIKIFSNTVSWGIAKKLNENLQIGTEFESSATKNNAKIEKNKQIYQEKKNQISNYAIQLGTSWSFSRENMILFGFKEIFHFYENSQSEKNLLIESKKFQTILEGISLNLCCLTKKYAIEFNLNTFNNNKKINTLAQQQEKKLTYAGSSWKISTALMKQINANTFLIFNPGIGKEEQKIEADEKNIEKIKEYYFKNTSNNDFNPFEAQEPNYYISEYKKDAVTISNFFLPILGIIIETKITPNIKIKLGTKTKYTLVTTTEEKIRITTPLKEIITKKTNEFTKEINIGLEYSCEKFAIDINVNKKVLNKENINIFYNKFSFS
ncbi:MAG: hypothetical protein ABIB46_06680, partial [bacterium]